MPSEIRDLQKLKLSDLDQIRGRANESPLAVFEFFLVGVEQDLKNIHDAVGTHIVIEGARSPRSVIDSTSKLRNAPVQESRNGISFADDAPAIAAHLDMSSFGCVAVDAVVETMV